VMVVFDPPRILFDVSVVSALLDTTFDVIIKAAGVANVPPRMPLVATVLACSMLATTAFADAVNNPDIVAVFAVSVLIVATFAVVGATKLTVLINVCGLEKIGGSANVAVVLNVAAAFTTSVCPIK